MVLEYDEIESIEEIGTEEIFDLEVPETECYFAHNILHHNSGKDRTISKMQVYAIYKLMCLKNPQKFLREKYGCNIGEGDAIDIANMSINSRQAINVYFKKFKQLLKSCINPRTKKNWFAENGVDLRDGYDVQISEVKFPHSITAHSLNSETNTGEGLNLFFATIDEFGSFAPVKGFELLDAIRDTVVTRFPGVGKVCVISYKYYHNDPMDILYKKELSNNKVYSSKAATFEVNLHITKEKLASQYLRNPEKSRITFECEGGEFEGGYVTKKYMLSKMFSPNHGNPIKGNLISLDASMLPNIQFKDWFKGSSGVIYSLHVDMATGKKDVKNDCAGLCLSHVEKMFPKMDEKLKKDLYSEGIIVDFISDDPELQVIRKGIVIDLAVQLVAKNGTEIQFSDVRKFILRLKRQLNFNIIFVTYDGWQSQDSIQILKSEGMYSDNLSVDKDNGAYDTWKELMYQQLVVCYPNSIAEREARELIINDRGKVDHPELSFEREQTENINTGSKDVMDCIVGSTKICYDKFSISSDIFFG